MSEAAPVTADNDVIEGIRRVVAQPWSEDRAEIVAELCARSDMAFFVGIHQFSMMVPEALAALSAFASASRGPILEVGPFVGASTMAIARGAAPEQVIVSIEAGGTSEHAVLGTDDILRDLKKNLAARGLGSRVRLLEMWAQDAYPLLPELLDDKRIGCLFIDADGALDYHLNQLRDLIADDCLLVFDDWTAPGKGDRVRRTLEKLMQRGALHQFGIVAGLTWFGRLAGPKARNHFVSCIDFEADLGHAYWARDVRALAPSDYPGGAPSTLRLFEDGTELGPAHAPHGAIRDHGKGMFSHWGDQILFSASDNSDPRTNGRQYQARSGDLSLDLN